MMDAAKRLCVSALLCGLLAACASTPQADNTVRVPPTAGVYKIGQPYQIGDTWYYPREQPDYDETGIASWYGPTFYGHRTANGETFNANALSAAHRTLPMPVNVRVTNLDNGRSLIVRVNDRGPYAKGRIIDLSEHAAELLGYRAKGTARVRVTYVGRASLDGTAPPDDTPVEVASAVPAAPTRAVSSDALASLPGTAIAAPVATAPLPKPAIPSADALATAEPTGVVSMVSVPAATHLYVQAGAFSSLANAERLNARLGGALSITTILQNGKKIYRLRLGPFEDAGAADSALARVMGLGSNDAHIVVDR